MKEARRTCNDRSAGLNQTSCSVCGDFKFYMKSLLRANVHISGAAYVRSPFRIFFQPEKQRKRKKRIGVWNAAMTAAAVAIQIHGT